MSGNFVQEIFTPVLQATGNAAVTTGPVSLGGFLCSVGGTMQLRDGGSGGSIIVATLNVISGQFIPIPAMIVTSLYAELTTATGTFFIGRNG